MKHLKTYKKIIRSIYGDADKEKVESIFNDKEKFSRVKRFIDDNPEVHH